MSAAHSASLLVTGTSTTAPSRLTSATGALSPGRSAMMEMLSSSTMGTCTGAPAKASTMSPSCKPSAAAAAPAVTICGAPAGTGKPAMKLAAKRTMARKKFMAGPAMSTAARAPRLAALKEPGVMSPASSPFMRAKPPKGSQLSVKSVPS